MGGTLDCDDPTTWAYKDMTKWNRSVTGMAAYIAAIAVPISTTSGVPGSSTSPTVSAPITLKDDEAALVSWNQKPRDASKYPILKNDADYQDWSLKKRRQLIQDALERVTLPTFNPVLTSSTCSLRKGPDTELARLQVNYFKQILCVVLQNPEGKGLLMTHPEDALYVWRNHESHQQDSDPAQIATTALMKKTISMKISNSNSRYKFLTSFQDACRQYDQLASTSMVDSFKKMLLQAAVMSDTALINSWNAVTEQKCGALFQEQLKQLCIMNLSPFLSNKPRLMTCIHHSKGQLVMRIKQLLNHFIMTK